MDQPINTSWYEDAHNKAHLLHSSEDGFIITTSYMVTNLLFICLKSSYEQSGIWPVLFLNLRKNLFLKNTNEKKDTCIKSVKMRIIHEIKVCNYTISRVEYIFVNFF